MMVAAFNIGQIPSVFFEHPDYGAAVHRFLLRNILYKKGTVSRILYSFYIVFRTFFYLLTPVRVDKGQYIRLQHTDSPCAAYPDMGQPSGVDQDIKVAASAPQKGTDLRPVKQLVVFHLHLHLREKAARRSAAEPPDRGRERLRGAFPKRRSAERGLFRAEKWYTTPVLGTGILPVPQSPCTAKECLL